MASTIAAFAGHFIWGIKKNLNHFWYTFLEKKKKNLVFLKHFHFALDLIFQQ